MGPGPDTQQVADSGDKGASAQLLSWGRRREQPGEAVGCACGGIWARRGRVDFGAFNRELGNKEEENNMQIRWGVRLSGPGTFSMHKFCLPSLMTS